ncbi:MAG: hypothetical protein ACK2T3_03325 [Candidatus Promineifilaceae bacterium]|jgi:recombination protein RecA
MISDRKQKLEKTMAALEDRWGSSAVQPLRQRLRSPVPHIPTGFPALDEATGIGGLPTGRITEIVGSPTSGTVTLALTLAARTQKKIGSIVYIDLGHNFDPTFAARCGLDMEQLILVRPKDTEHALSILLDFISDGTVGALVFDADPFLLSDYQSTKALAATLGRIISPLSQSSCMLLFVTSQQKSEQQTNASYGDRNTNGSLIPHHSAIRLQIQREKWLYKDGDIAGYKAQISVVKNKLGAAGKQANMSIWLYGNRSFEIATAAGAKPEGGAS